MKRPASKLSSERPPASKFKHVTPKQQRRGGEDEFWRKTDVSPQEFVNFDLDIFQEINALSDTAKEWGWVGQVQAAGCQNAEMPYLSNMYPEPVLRSAAGQWRDALLILVPHRARSFGMGV